MESAGGFMAEVKQNAWTKIAENYRLVGNTVGNQEN